MTTTRVHPRRVPVCCRRDPTGLSTLSGGMAASFQMLAPHGRERETNGTLTCMTAFVAFLVERLHVDLGRVSTAVCMAG